MSAGILLWLAIVASADAVVCQDLLLPGEAGERPGDLCELARRLSADGLRQEARECVERMRRAERQRYGNFEFRVLVAAGKVRVEAVAPGSHLEGLRRCLATPLRQRLAGWPGTVEISLRLRVPPGKGEDFGLRWSAPLAPRAVRRPPPPLPGTFKVSLQGVRGSCSLGERRLVLEMAPPSSMPEPGPRPAEPEPEAVRACLEPPPDARRKVRPAPDARECLFGLLHGVDPNTRAAAAEEIARRRFAGSRRRLQEALESRLTQLSSTPPASAEQGSGLLREAWALLSLGGTVPPAAWSLLAGHPDGEVRRAMVVRLLACSRRPLPQGAETLLRDADETIRLQACEIACRAGDPRGPQELFAFLDGAAVERRAQAALLAPACLRLARGRSLSFIERESETLVGLLWLNRVFAPPADLVERIAGPALEDACPVARWLAARLLQCLPSPPREMVRAVLPREGDERLRTELRRLLAEEPAAPRREVMRLWIEPTM
ncbi:MAG: hypothetical protein GYA21_17970 [Myxococcales bacterium]|nr:hypothetical protein [Myxococcales bacterium]